MKERPGSTRIDLHTQLPTPHTLTHREYSVTGNRFSPNGVR
jgi:hypothetical protein